MAFFTQGQEVQYYSASHQQWVDTIVEQLRSNGDVIVSCKPGYWIPVEEQRVKLRARRGAGCGGGVAGVDQRGVAQARPAAPDVAASPSVGATPSHGSDKVCAQRSTYNEEISPEQQERIRRVLSTPESTRSAAAVFFQRYDADRSGGLDPTELRECLLAMQSEFGIPAPHTSHVKMLIQKYDVNADGVLSLPEFEEFFQRLMLRTRKSFMAFKVQAEFFVQKQEGSPWGVFEAEKKLGEGTFGITHLVRDRRSAQTRVLKTINKAKSQMPPEELEQEIDALRKLDHPHIIKLFEYYEDPVNIYLVMEEALGGELLKTISEQYKSGWRLGERWTATVMQQVLEAIAYCHGRRLMHKDLKAENIMLLRAADSKVTPHAVVIDLGLAEMFGGGLDAGGGQPPVMSMAMRAAGKTQDDVDSALYQRIRSRRVGGTPTTMAPEVWEAFMDPSRGGFGMKCDVWSLGVVLYQLLTGQVPFIAASIQPMEWLGVIRRGLPEEPLSARSPQAQDLVRRMLEVAEQRRPTAREALRHQWLAEKSATADVKLSDSQMQSLCEFDQKNEFQKAVLLQAAAQIRAADMPRLNAIFRRYDADNSGYLKKEDLISALQAMGIEAETARRASAAIDLDRNGKIEYTEFVAACISRHDELLQAHLAAIFGKLDKDKTGVLRHSEVRQLLTDSELRGLGFAPSEREISEIVRGMDAGNTGYIRFEDFSRYCNPR